MKRCKQKAQSSECCSQIVLCLAVLTANKVILSSVFEGGAAEGDRERPNLEIEPAWSFGFVYNGASWMHIPILSLKLSRHIRKDVNSSLPNFNYCHTFQHLLRIEWVLMKYLLQRINKHEIAIDLRQALIVRC